MNFDFNQDLVLENDRVVLSPLTMQHFEHLLPVGAQDEQLTFFSTYSVFTPENLQAFITDAVADRLNKVRYAFTIFDKKSGQFAGSTSFASNSNKDKRLEIGWTWLGNDFQQTGLNLNCKFLLLQYVYEVLEFERVEFKTDERNVKSRTAIEKIGGRFEGILRSHILMRNGFRRSSVCYSILKAEWPAVKQQLEKRRLNHL